MKKWEIMKASEEGAEIEFNCKGITEWQIIKDPLWSWDLYTYRIKPKEPEVDWDKVAIDTPILVRNDETRPWEKRYFCRIDGHGICAYDSGTTSRTSTDYSTWAWKYAKLDLEAKSIINWLPNMGDKPVTNQVVLLKIRGKICSSNSDDLTWDLNAYNPITHYAIIE